MRDVLQPDYGQIEQLLLSELGGKYSHQNIFNLILID